MSTTHDVYRNEAGEGRGRAVEVAATMGGSVMSVTHLLDPRSGRITPVTRALFALGALMLCGAAVAFAVGIHNAGANKASRAAWIAEKRPVHAWRPAPMSAAYDWMALGGATAGLVLLTAGLARVRGERRSPYFRIGSDPDAEFATADAPASSFPLVAPAGDQFFFHFTPDMDGEARLRGRSWTLAELAAQGRARPSARAPGAFELAIAGDAKIRVRVGRSGFCIASVPAPRQQIMPLLSAIDSRALAFVAGSAAVHLAFWALLRTVPPDAHAIGMDLAGREARMIRAQIKAREEPRRAPQARAGQDTAGDRPGVAMAPREPSRQARRGRAPRSPGAAAREPSSVHEARARARQSGMLGALRGSGVLGQWTGAAGMPSGMSDQGVYTLGGGRGTVIGFGTLPTGVAGGGPTGGTIHSGRYRTVTGRGCGVDSECLAGMPQRRAREPAVEIGAPAASGGLDRSIIRRHVRTSLASIRYCYEKQLTIDPDLAGTVTSTFQINPRGKVLSARATGVSEPVSSCVAAAIERITFPAPKRGTLVEVTYPFTFRPVDR